MRLLSLIACVCCFAVAGAPEISRAAAPAAGTKIATVNPFKVFNQIQETKDLREQLKVRQQELAAKEQQLRAGIETMYKEAAQINPNHPNYVAKLEQIDNAKASLQSWGTATKASLERQNKQMLKSLYDKIEAAVSRISQAEGYDLVLSDGRQDFLPVEEMQSDDLRRVLNARNVLYSNANIDLTEKVITMIDQDYNKQKAAGPAPAGPAPAPIPAPAPK